MKRILLVLLVTVLLTGCGDTDQQLDKAMELRAQMIAKTVSFDAGITADYGDKSYCFGMKCRVDTKGELTFEVTEPESIAGITGTVSGTGGKLTFDDTALAFGLMADGQLSPVSAPWVVVRTLRSGYLTSCTQEGEMLRLSIDDSYEDDALHLDIWLDAQNIPKTAEIFWQGRRLLSVTVANFTME